MLFRSNAFNHGISKTLQAAQGILGSDRKEMCCPEMNVKRHKVLQEGTTRHTLGARYVMKLRFYFRQIESQQQHIVLV